MEVQSWKCVICEKVFKPGNWVCIDGLSNHVVETKEYLLDDAPTDPGHPSSGGMDTLRDGRTRICNMPPDKTVVVNGETQRVPGGYVEFIRGRFSTADPEIQYWLDKKGGFCTEQRWREAWLSDNQRLRLDRMKLEADQQRLENDRNEMLAEVKQRTRARA